MRRLFFMRHAQPVEREAWAGEENDRPLAPDGVRDTEKAAGCLAAIGLRVDAVLSSPLVRALRTAEIVGAALKPPRKPVVDGRLAPGFGADALEDILDEREGLESFLFVGHEPDLGLVVGNLVSCPKIEFKKGALALVEIDDDGEDARLLWLIPQKVLAAASGRKT
jgi:phosphohistidine phosphatase